VFFALWTYFHGSTLVTHALQSLGMTSQFLGFRLEDVVVEGRVRTDKNEILKKLELERGKSLLSINFPKLKSILEELSWVNAVRSRKTFS
jgi:cell division septal protein FtsQ